MADTPDPEEAPEAPDLVKHQTLNQALRAAMLEFGYVRKRGEHSQGWSYATDADLVRVVRPAFLRHGLVGPIPIEIRSLDHETIPTRNSSTIHARVIVVYEIRHVDSGEVLRFESAGTGQDTQDKSVYKALTGAFKYALRHPLLIETGDDPEREEGSPGDEVEHLRAKIRELEQQLQSGGGAGRDELDRAAQAGRSFVIRGLYDKASVREDFDGRALAALLKERELPTLTDVKHFVLWLGRPKLASLEPAAINKMVDFLASDQGKAKFNEFAQACGL